MDRSGFNEQKTEKKGKTGMNDHFCLPFLDFFWIFKCAHKSVRSSKPLQKSSTLWKQSTLKYTSCVGTGAVGLIIPQHLQYFRCAFKCNAYFLCIGMKKHHLGNQRQEGGISEMFLSFCFFMQNYKMSLQWLWSQYDVNKLKMTVLGRAQLTALLHRLAKAQVYGRSPFCC